MEYINYDYIIYILHTMDYAYFTFILYMQDKILNPLLEAFSVSWCQILHIFDPFQIEISNF